MTPEFLAAVIDTLLPGDDTLPSATRAGLDPTAYAVAHRPILDAIAARAGGPETFLRTDENARAAVLSAVERATPDAFRTLLSIVLSDYYEVPVVLTALGWRSEPPQPKGHAIPSLDASGNARLERVRRRGQLWRG